MKKLISVASILLVVVLLFTACNSPSGAPETGTPSSQEPATVKDTIIIGKGSDFKTIVPGSDTGPFASDGIIFLAMFDTLVNYDSTTGEYSPGLATEWDISDDGLQYTLKIRDDVYFHNGTKMTVDDVAWSFNMLNENEAFKSSVYPTFDRAEVVDENTVTIYLSKPFAPFFNSFCSYVFAVLSEDYYNEVGGWEGYIANPIGCGPYKFVSYQTGNEFVMVANENYWGEPAKIKNVRIKIIADSNSRMLALESGDIDVNLDASINSLVQLGDAQSIDWNYCSAYGTVCILYAHTNPLISEDENLRKAITAGIDYEGVGAVINEGYSVKAELLAAPPLTARPDDGTYTESLKYDPVAAAEYLAASNYKEGTEIRYIVQSGSKNESVAKVVQGSLQSIGINVQILSLDSATYSQQWMSGDYELCGVAPFPPHLDANNMFTFFDTSMAIVGDSVMPGIDRINELGKAAQIEGSTENRKEMYAEIAGIINEHALCAPIYYDLATLAWDSSLNNIDVKPLPIYNVAGWNW